ncbi:class I SAM-dependent methyltransferase [Algoriphagus limi]|uniref:Class I SAM-dependent methyltransferase n=1 Tax=Algoriphagus limi TaxID=2975273 RepID=A0ABT2G4Z0_9BACT|nr:class I SAM-dependent methyltransferase [Algoriphagus limi]MCS5489022.1 class I SAM-dependent methyltransferase [Algoriphagus limi]
MIKYIHTKETHNEKAPDLILPIVFDFFSPNSILDIGCGIGTWLSVAKKLGFRDVKGVDGDYVDRKLLGKYLIDEEFVSHDLTQPIDLGKKFDLCICLEVAEHLPESAADTLVECLKRHSEIILFSAAIPGQGGQNHLNEQWPVYWAEKFSKHSYVFLDIIRPLIWNNPNVDFWYKQNIFLVVKDSNELASKFPSSSLSLVHPELYETKNQIFEKRIAFLERQLKVHPLKRWLSKLMMKK